jgi:hypothetical protein
MVETKEYVSDGRRWYRYSSLSLISEKSLSSSSVGTRGLGLEDSSSERPGMRDRLGLW